MNEAIEGAKPLDFCASQIALWERHALALRALVEGSARSCNAPPSVARALAVCSCADRGKHLDAYNAHGVNVGAVIAPITDDTLEALQRAIALCEMEAENWRARERASRGGR